MKNLILSFLILFSTLAFAQDYTIEDGNVVVSKVVENIEGSKDEIYNRVKSYFVRSYGDANSVIQTDDKSGGLIIGKGLYTNLATSKGFSSYGVLDAYHIIRVDIKEGKIRIICSASDMVGDFKIIKDLKKVQFRIIDYIPFTDKDNSNVTKKAHAQAFESLIKNMKGSIAGIEDAVKKGGVLNSEKSDW